MLHPLLPYAGKSPRWILSPDGQLWLTPWAALPLPDGTYTVEKHTLSCVISGRDLVDRAPAKAAPTAPLVLADPDFDLDPRRLPRNPPTPSETRGLSKALRLGNIPRLPATATEAAAITAPLRKYAGAAPQVHTDKEATAGVFLAARHPKVVVLSTHGYFLSDQEISPKEREDPGRREATPHGLRLENPLLRCGVLLAMLLEGVDLESVRRQKRYGQLAGR